MWNRRKMLMGAGAAAGFAAFAPAAAVAQGLALRGSIDAGEFGVQPGSDDQSAAFADMLRKASERNLPLFLPSGTYRLANIELSARTRLSGVPGATRILYGGGGFLFAAESAEWIDLAGLIFDGADQPLSDRVRAALDLRAVRHLSISGCEIIRSSKTGLSLAKAGGRIEDNTISGATDVGLYALDSAGLTITDNRIADCGNGGILVHRSEIGEDGTIVAGNRVERIRAANGGTGQFGNGINIFRAGNVMISGNRIADCAFSAIRSNSGSNVQIANNSCLQSGETAIYSEFAFEGASISGNIVDGAANGISVVNFNEGGRLATVSGNLVRNLSERGPYPADAPGFGSGIVVEADTSVTGNTIEAAPLHGIRIGWGPYMRNVAAVGNVIRQAEVGIAVSVVDGVGPAVISGNVISECPGGAVVGYRWSDPVTTDLAKTPGHGFPGLTVEANQAD